MRTIIQEDIPAQIKRAMSLSDEHFSCRSMGHKWIQVKPFVDPAFGIPECFFCQDGRGGGCGMFRVDVVSKRYGELLDRWYVSPDGYAHKTPEDGSRSFSAAGNRAARLKRVDVTKLPDITPAEGGVGDG